MKEENEIQVKAVSNDWQAGYLKLEDGNFIGVNDDEWCVMESGKTKWQRKLVEGVSYKIRQYSTDKEMGSWSSTRHGKVGVGDSNRWVFMGGYLFCDRTSAGFHPVSKCGDLKFLYANTDYDSGYHPIMVEWVSE